MNTEIVPLEVAVLLKNKLNYNKPSFWVYNNSSNDLRYSIEPGLFNSIWAPTINDAVNFLWGVGIKIFYFPKFNGCQGIIKIKDVDIKIPKISNTPKDVYRDCLIYLSSLL